MAVCKIHALHVVYFEASFSPFHTPLLRRYLAQRWHFAKVWWLYVMTLGSFQEGFVLRYVTSKPFVFQKFVSNTFVLLLLLLILILETIFVFYHQYH